MREAGGLQYEQEGPLRYEQAALQHEQAALQFEQEALTMQAMASSSSEFSVKHRSIMVLFIA